MTLGHDPEGWHYRNENKHVVGGFSLVQGQDGTTLKGRTTIGFGTQGFGLVPAREARMNLATTELRFKYEIPSTKS